MREGEEKKMDSRGRSSTASTVSGVFKTILQSPAPICMFYFSHPFGISSPLMIEPRSNGIDVNPFDIGTEKKRKFSGGGGNFGRREEYQRIRRNSLKERYYQDQQKFIPWPRDAWRGDIVLPPLPHVHAQAKKQKGKAAPDLETILRTIRQAWYTPNSRSLLQSRAREDFDTPTSSLSLMFTNTKTKEKMGSGANATPTPTASGLLRRRYSVPEIIMRKHNLAQQKSLDESMATTAPSLHISPLPGYALSTSSSSSRRGVTMSTGSDSNLSHYRGFHDRGEMSMRKSTLLRRIWSKELKRYDMRSGSWSPPMRRSQRRLHAEPVEHVRCEECRKLDNTHDDEEEALPKRVRYSSQERVTATPHSSTMTPPTRNLRRTRHPITSSNSLPDRVEMAMAESEPKNLHIFMTSMDDNDSSTESGDHAQDMLRVEIEIANVQTTQSSNHSSNTSNSCSNNNNSNEDCSISNSSNNHNNNNRSCSDNNSVNGSNSEGFETKSDRNETEQSLEKTCPIDSEKNGNDSPIDRFISKLLIDNLNELVTEISKEMETNNNNNNNGFNDDTNRKSNNDQITTRDMENNEISPTQRLETSSVYISPEQIEAVVSRANVSAATTFSTTSAFHVSETVTPDTGMQNRLTQTGPITSGKTIYFPNYLMEAKEDMSSYTSNYSDLDLSEMGNSEMVKVSTGSSYALPENKESVIVPRILVNFPRTESLEAQPSSASNGEEEAGDGSEEESVSLVDSLDDPTSARPEKNTPVTDKEKENIQPPILKEKGEAFFVPITDTEIEITQSVPVADSMPEKLKEKIIQRQKGLDAKREEELKKKQKKIEKMMDPKLNEDNFCEKSQISKKGSPVKERPPQSKKSATSIRGASKNKASQLRNEIGLLESYTIDSKGYMQFKVASKQDLSTKSGRKSKVQKSINKRTDASRPIEAVETSSATSTVLAAPVSIVETFTTTAVIPSSVASPTIEATPTPNVAATTDPTTTVTVVSTPATVPVSKKKSTNKQKKNSKSTSSSTSTVINSITEPQKMIVFQPQSDIITPDIENGPRRVYQKTEIQDGEKCIEILEIVECNASSDENSPDRHIGITYRCCGSKSSLPRTSKIPIPVYKSAGKHASRSQCRESNQAQSKSLSRNLQGNSTNKVDRVIAELLIDALNRPDEVGIEIVKSPKEAIKEKLGRRQSLPKRNTPRRSANSSKYHQTFEVIPEEKGSQSVDSSNDENCRISKSKSDEVTTTGDKVSAGVRSVITQTSDITDTYTLPTKSSSCTSLPSRTTSSSTDKMAKRGRACIDTIEPKAWIGFFKHHNGTSLDEDESQSQPYGSTSTENTRQHTISSPSTMTAMAGSTPAKISSETGCPTSSESENILKLIDKTFTESSGQNQSAETKESSSNTTKTTSSVVTTDYTKESINYKSCQNSKRENGDSIETTTTENIVKIEIETSCKSFEESTSTTPSTSNERTSADETKNTPASPKVIHNHRSSENQKVDVWRVQSPDICKHAIPKSKINESKTSNNKDANKLKEKISNDCEGPSFVIVPDSEHSATSNQRFPTTTGSSSAADIDSKTAYSDLLTTKCSSCCFCTPELHKLNTEAATLCVYCNRKKSPQKKEEETNTEGEFFENQTFYEKMSKSDHTHTRTRSRDSDVISTKCTKINEKIKRFIPDDKVNGNQTESTTKTQKSFPTTRTKNLNRPKNVNNLPKNGTSGMVQKPAQNGIKTNEINSKAANTTSEGKSFRFPSPYTILSSNSYDGTSSPTSSSDTSTCPTTPSKCPQLPPATRRQNYPNRNMARRKLFKHQENSQKSSKDNTVAVTDPTNNNNNNNTNANEVKPNGQNAGWSVTLAGSYNQDLAPDVEMRLSFPKNPNYQSQQEAPPLQQQQVRQNVKERSILQAEKDIQTITNGNIYTEQILQDEEDIINDNYTRLCHATLPANTTITGVHSVGSMNPKRTLTRATSVRSQSNRDLNFPEVSTGRQQMVSKQLAKKAIKHMECSVAMTAATRTISNYARGRRTMSYQALNTSESHRITNRGRHVRDNSLDLGNLSSRHMSPDCHTPSDMLALSIMGNAIAPEQKPRVPTMSEKDLTRRHNGCFTRNRAFFT